MSEREKDLEASWQQATDGLDPRVKEALGQLRRGEITLKGFDLISREVYEPTPKEEAIGFVALVMFQNFLRGVVTKEQLDGFVNLLNEDPDAILLGKERVKE